jgi:hypothetical protein
MRVELINCKAGDTLAATPRAAYRLTFRKRAIAIGRDFAAAMRVVVDRIGPNTPAFAISDATIDGTATLGVVDARTDTNSASTTVATLIEKCNELSYVAEIVRIERLGTVPAGGIPELSQGRGVEITRAGADPDLAPLGTKIAQGVSRTASAGARTLSIVALAAIVLGVVYLSRTYGVKPKRS